MKHLPEFIAAVTLAASSLGIYAFTPVEPEPKPVAPVGEFAITEDVTPIESNPTPGWRRWRIKGQPITARFQGFTETGNVILEIQQDGSFVTPRPEHCDVLSMNGSPIEE